jgi:hypothetical protein
MEKIGIVQKIDTLYTKAKKVIIGKESIDGTPLQDTLETLKTFKKNNVKKVKEVGLKQAFLTMGEPEEKDVLYKEVVKREQQEIKDARKVAKELEKSKKKIASEKNKKETSTKTSISKKKTTSKKAPTEKTITKKTVTKKDTSTKVSTKEKKTEKKKSTKTTSSAPRGAKKAAKIALYIKDIKKHYGEVDEEFVAIIVKNLGPSIYKRDAELVSCSDPKELDTVRKNFLMKKLGINASQGVLDAAIADVCEELKSTRTKYRATFYYSLAKKFKKESVLS